MLVIFSTADDLSTNKVIKWLITLGVQFCRINDEDKINLESLSLNNSSFELKITSRANKVWRLNSNDIKASWYRRGNFRIHFPSYQSEINSKIEGSINRYLKDEMRIVEKYILKIIKRKPHLNKHSDNYINKLLSLDAAMKSGLKVPETSVHTNPQNIKSLVQEKRQISKSLDLGWVPIKKENNDISIYGFTNEITEDHPYLNHETVFPSLIQGLIEKMFELRIFYIDDQFFATAIFSQNDKQTEIDFRNYNWKKHNRVVPYKLPNDLISKLEKYTRLVDVNCGSIDMVFNKSGEYIFLENNPVGQFDQVSRPTNFNLEKIVAEKLYELSQ